MIDWFNIVFILLWDDSSRMVGLVQLLLKYNAASSLVEDYATCLELRSEESQIIENSGDDPGVLIMQVCLISFLEDVKNVLKNYLWCLHILSYTFWQLLIDNISRPAPNITHLLLKFDLDTPIERTVLQPKFHYRLFGYNLPLLTFIFPMFLCLVVHLLCHFQLLEDYSWNFGEGFKARCKCIASRIWFSGKLAIWSVLFILFLNIKC